MLHFRVLDKIVVTLLLMKCIFTYRSLSFIHIFSFFIEALIIMIESVLSLASCMCDCNLERTKMQELYYNKM